MAAVAVVCGVTAGVLLRSDSEPKKESAGTELVGLGPQGAEFGALLAKGKQAVFHARYSAVSDDPEAAGQELSMELWRKAPRERFDVTISAGGTTARSSGFRLPKDSVACTSEADGPWTCQPAEAGAAGPDALIAQVAAEMKGRTIVARDDRIGGSSVRCFTLPLDSYPGEVCVTRTGVPARVSAGPSRIELVELTTTVPDQVFSPPATPTKG
ncbi:MAG: hypothetical protein ACR2MO_08300 [Acidimicrobiales bacterium]